MDTGPQAVPCLKIDLKEFPMADEESASPLKKLLPFTTAGVLLAAIYAGYILYSRSSENREAAEKARQQEVAGEQRTVDAYGGGRVKVLNFTLSSGMIHRGEKINVCYGVSNAKTVNIDPKPDSEVWPSISRCVEASPKKDTTYTLTATDEKGQSESKSLEVKVK
jgi:hypothetical protein